MTGKRFTRDEHTGYLYDNGEIVEDVMKLLNALNDENEQLKKENQGIQNKVWRLLNWLSDVEKVITKEQVKEWWNNEMINDD